MSLDKSKLITRMQSELKDKGFKLEAKQTNILLEAIANAIIDEITINAEVKELPNDENENVLSVF